jgi:hypothetical protein
VTIAVRANPDIVGSASQSELLSPTHVDIEIIENVVGSAMLLTTAAICDKPAIKPRPKRP